MSLFGVLKQADPALVDPGVTAQLECLLDDVVVGRQEMVGAIDAVCSVAERIIGKSEEGGAAVGDSLAPACCVGNGPGTLPPKDAADEALRRQSARRRASGLLEAARRSISICRGFLNEHVPKKAQGDTVGELDFKLGSLVQMLVAEQFAQGKGIATPDDAKANRPRCPRG